MNRGDEQCAHAHQPSGILAGQEPLRAGAELRHRGILGLPAGVFHAGSHARVVQQLKGQLRPLPVPGKDADCRSQVAACSNHVLQIVQHGSSNSMIHDRSSEGQDRATC